MSLRVHIFTLFADNREDFAGGVLHKSWPEILLKKEIPARVFSCEFCEIFKNNFFIEHFW